MLSMTGYGRGEYKENGIELTVEVKTVNNRYLDINIKAPRIFSATEEKIRNSIRGKITRGRIDAFVSYTDKREKARILYLDESLVKAYADAAERVKRIVSEAEYDLTVSQIMRYPEVISGEDEKSFDGELESACITAFERALDNLNEMRLTEGEKLKTDMLSRMLTIEKLKDEVALRAPSVAENYRLKLQEKMKKILSATEVDEGRLLQEAALFSDKCNIDEELTRLNSHISQFREICGETLVGRKLDFLVQEFNRETNTICSKSNDLEITRLALTLKNEIEKVREQVQNVE